PILDRLSEADALIAKRLMGERTGLEARIAELARSEMIYGGPFTAEPAPTHRLHRGDAMQKREEIKPGALSAVPVLFTTNLGRTANGMALTDDQRRRLAFAEWIVNPTNPLTARVMV